MIKKIKHLSKSVKVIIFLFVLISSAYAASWVLGYGQNNNSDGLVLDLTLSEENYNAATKTFSDQSGNNNNGVSFNNATFSVDKDGKSAGAMSFNGLNDEVRINASSSYKTPSVTVSFWFKPQNQSKRHVLVTTWSGFTTELNSDGTFKWGLSGPTGQYYGTKKIPWDEWSYLTGTFDNNTKRQCIYINGVLQECQTVSGSIGYTTADLYVSGNWDRVKGQFGNIKIYNRSLSAEEVQGLYSTTKPKLQASSLEKGLVGYWPLDGENYNSNTSRVTDKSAYSNHGTNNGATLTEDRFGKSEGAMKFGNTTAWERITTPIQAINYNLTMCAWVKPTSYPTERSTILLGSGSYYLSLYADGSLHTYWYGRNPAGYHSSTPGVMPLNEWSYGCAVWSNNNVSLYINGVQQNMVAIDNTPGNNPSFLLIGAESPSRQLKGDIAEARIYNRALSDEEISSLYEKDAPKISSSSLKKGLVLDMPLTSQYTKGGAVGSEILVDNSPYNNNGQNNVGILGLDNIDFYSGKNVSIVNNNTINQESISISFWARHRDYVYPRTFGAIKKSWPNCYTAGGLGWDFGHSYHSTGIDVCVGDGVHTVRNTLTFNAGSRPSDLLNTWAHITYVIDRDNNQVRAYINGAKQTNEIDISAVTGSIKNPSLITLGTLYGWYMDANVSNLKIYNRVLSATEVKSLYDQGRGETAVILGGN